jgi:hypothetical protein
VEEELDDEVAQLAREAHDVAEEAAETADDLRTLLADYQERSRTSSSARLPAKTSATSGAPAYRDHGCRRTCLSRSTAKPPPLRRPDSPLSPITEEVQEWPSRNRTPQPSRPRAYLRPRRSPTRPPKIPPHSPRASPLRRSRPLSPRPSSSPPRRCGPMNPCRTPSRVSSPIASMRGLSRRQPRCWTWPWTGSPPVLTGSPGIPTPSRVTMPPVVRGRRSR